jgi:hypothetical protein
MSELQRATSRHISYIYAGSQFGGSGDPEVGRTVSDQRADQAGDVDTPSIDQTYVELVLNEKVGEEFVSLTVTQGLLGLVYPDATSEYYVFIDLDGSPEEGGFPEELGLPTQMGGVELVIQVLVDVDRHASATVWRYDGNEFVDETDSAVLEVQLTSPDGGEEPTPMFDVVTTTLGFSLGTLEIGEELVNIQTVATDGAAFDVLPGEAGAGSSDQVVPLYIVEPELPEG